MPKKCNYCGKKIDVYSGKYVNYYPSARNDNPIAAKMESFHSECFVKLYNAGHSEHNDKGEF